MFVSWACTTSRRIARSSPSCRVGSSTVYEQRVYSVAALVALAHSLTRSRFLPHPFGQWYTGNAHLPSGTQPMIEAQAWCLPEPASSSLRRK